jgi:transcriptional regulator with XRE-family HTH domain
MLINAKEIAARIKVERNKLGYTQEELSEILSIGRVHLANIELGTRMASLDLLVAMCEAFGCSLDYLVLGSKSSNTVTKELLKSAMELLRSAYNAID